MATVQQAKEILAQSQASGMIRDVIAERCGKTKADAVWDTAAEKLAAITEQYPDIPKGEQMHAKGIFNAAALYQALQTQIPEQAMALITEGMKRYALETAKKFQKMVRMPCGKLIFMKGFAFGAKTMFGESGGFRQQMIRADRNELRFDVLDCPYVRYLTALGCPEIAPLFCENDVYTYSNLDGIRFERSETLGQGGTKCDFHLKRIGRK